MSDPTPASDVRISVAAALLLFLGLATLLVLTGSSSSQTTPPAPQQCISLWNQDRKALVSGYHYFHSHRYTEAEMMRVGPSGEPARHGACAVVFAATTLDPEQSAAVRVFSNREWMAFSAVRQVSDVRLAELQAKAHSAANVLLRPDGTLIPIK